VPGGVKAMHDEIVLKDAQEILSAARPQSPPQDFLRQAFYLAVEFARCASRLLDHGRIEQQRNAAHKGRLFLLNFSALARSRRLGLTRFGIRI
jgi:hypothetical protein